MNRPSGVGRTRPAELLQSRGMNDVFVTDNSLCSAGSRYDEFGAGGMPPDRAGFGLR